MSDAAAEDSPAEPAQPEPSHTGAARPIAITLLQLILERGQGLDEALESCRGWEELSPTDRAFARLLTTTTLRRLGQIDALLAHLVKRPPPRKARVVWHVLRLGVAQLVFLGTPPHAGVATSVALVEQLGHARFKGLANAVLRRVAREGATWLADRDAYRLNLPAWLRESWEAAYGAESCRAIHEILLVEAALDVTLRDPGEVALWADRLDARQLPLGEATPTIRRMAVDRETQNRQRVHELPGFVEGGWWVQDAAAALPGRLAARDVFPGREAIELCAAPGGKTTQLAALGYNVTAVDRHEKRLARLRRNLDRTGLAAEAVRADATSYRPERPVPLVLLDAPCSGTGTLRRHPEIAWLKDRGEVRAMLDVQWQLLLAAAEMVAPGGTLIYCICALEPEEGEDQIAAFLAQDGRFTTDPVDPAEIGGHTAAITEQGWLRTLPCHLAEWGGMDGFFAARLQRRDDRPETEAPA